MVAFNTEWRDLTLAVSCGGCGCTCIIDVKMDDYNAWVEGRGLIQNLMPYLSADEREMLISCTCNKCWDIKFGTLDN